MPISKDKSLVNIKKKIKNFFKKISTNKDVAIDRPKQEPFDSSEQHLYRDDLKFY